MYANCSTTARRGALDWHDEFYQASKPVFQKLYTAVKDGSETQRTLESNSDPNVDANFERELKEIRNSEMWQAGVAVRSLRPQSAPQMSK